MRRISRKTFLKLLPVGAVLAATGWYWHAQQTTPPTLMRGISIGNALEAPKATPWDVTMDTAYFDAIAAAGFDTVRLPVRFSDYLGDAPDYTLDEDFMQEIDGYIADALHLGLTLVLDCHHFEEIMQEPWAYADALYAIWTQLGTRYAHTSSKLVFELLNEPNDQMTPAIWSEILLNTLACVRVHNPDRLVVIDAPYWGSIEGLSHLYLPDDDNIVASVHYYDPMEFTFQGDVYQPDYTDYTNVTWLGSDDEMAVLTAAFEGVQSWAQAQGVAVWLGEFGANQNAPSASRRCWTQAVVQTAEGCGMGWCYWELASQFGIYDADTDSWDEEMLAAMMV